MYNNYKELLTVTSHNVFRVRCVEVSKEFAGSLVTSFNETGCY